MLNFYLNQVKTTRRFMLSLFFISICCSPVALNSTSNASSYFVTLLLNTFGGGLEKDCALYIQQCLAEVGIKVEIKVEEWIEFVGTLLVTHYFDLAIVSFGKSALGLNVHTVFEQNDLHVINAKDPDPTAIYAVDASLNIFGLNRDIPYVDDSEKMIREGVTITVLKKRQEHYYAWQQLIMDKIVPILPLFTQRSYVAVWSNFKGYDNRWDIVDSLPYIYYEGEHDNISFQKENRLFESLTHINCIVALCKTF